MGVGHHRHRTRRHLQPGVVPAMAPPSPPPNPPPPSPLARRHRRRFPPPLRTGPGHALSHRHRNYPQCSPEYPPRRHHLHRRTGRLIPLRRASDRFPSTGSPRIDRIETTATAAVGRDAGPSESSQCSGRTATEASTRFRRRIRPDAASAVARGRDVTAATNFASVDGDCPRRLWSANPCWKIAAGTLRQPPPRSSILKILRHAVVQRDVFQGESALGQSALRRRHVEDPEVRSERCC